jgi:creatinine amidohydrolase
MSSPTDIFQYENLTWPEVAALPRDVPLVIPLGEGYDMLQLSERLGKPARLGMLPAIPYGWAGSGLEIPGAVFSPLARNLADSLRDDGFTRVLHLMPSGTNLDLGENAIDLEKRASSGSLHGLEPSRVLLIPVGHTEQHGHHLGLNTDTLIIDAIARGTAAALPERATTLPVMPYGVSTHRRAFAGTLNAGGRAFEDFYLGVVDALVARGFDRLYLMSGHGGNCSFLTTVVNYAGERHRRAFIATSWLYLSGPDGVAALEELRRSKIGGMGHACELETSLILYLHPELVRLDRILDETDFVATPSYFMDWIEGGALVANPPWDDDSRTGAYGAGSLATAEHGRLWLEAAIAEKVAHAREIDEQHRRREARRTSGFGLWGEA